MGTKVTVKLSSSGFKVDGFVIDSKILKDIKKATIEDALYEDNPISVVGNLAKRSIPIATGFCIGFSDELSCSVTVNNQVVPIESIGILYEGCNFEEEFTTPRQNTLIAREELSERLGENEKIEKDEMLIVEIQEFKLAELECDFESSNAISIQELELGLIDLDVDTEISNAVYQTGLLSGMEKDIRYLIYDQTKHEFGLDILNGYASKFYLTKRNSNGEWVAKFLG